MQNALVKCDRCGKTEEVSKIAIGMKREEFQWYTVRVEAERFPDHALGDGLKGDLCHSCYASLRKFWDYFQSNREAEALFEDRLKNLHRSYQAAAGEQCQKHSRELNRLMDDWQKETETKVAEAKKECETWCTRRLAAALEKARASHEADTKIRIARALTEARLLRARNKRSRTAKKRKKTKP